MYHLSPSSSFKPKYFLSEPSNFFFLKYYLSAPINFFPLSIRNEKPLSAPRIKTMDNDSTPHHQSLVGSLIQLHSSSFHASSSHVMWLKSLDASLTRTFLSIQNNSSPPPYVFYLSVRLLFLSEYVAPLCGLSFQCRPTI